MDNQKQIKKPVIEKEPVVIFDARWSQQPTKNRWYKRLGFLSFSLSLALFLLFLSPMLIPQLASDNNQPSSKKVVVKKVKPEKENFLITINKIGLVNAQILRQVDVSDKKIYDQALKQGVAHAKGTAYPGQGKMVFLFGHSTSYPWLVDDINALFFQLETLEKDDPIKIEFNGQSYVYYVYNKEVVSPNQVEVVYDNLEKDILVLQTCYPPGTYSKRLLIFAKPSKFGGLISDSLDN